MLIVQGSVLLHAMAIVLALVKTIAQHLVATDADRDVLQVVLALVVLLATHCVKMVARHGVKVLVLDNVLTLACSDVRGALVLAKVIVRGIAQEVVLVIAV